MKEQPIKIKKVKNQIKDEDVINPIKDGISNGTTGTIWEKIGEACFYLLVGLTSLFFLPLTAVPVEINKQIFAGLLMLIAFACYLINSFEKGKVIYPKSLLSLSILILLVILGISTIFSKAKEVSLYGNFFQSDSLMSFVIYGLTFFMAAIFFSVRDKFSDEVKRINRLGFFFFGGLALTVILGLFQILGQKIQPLRQIWLEQIIGFNTIGSLLDWAIFSAFGLIVIIAVLFNGVSGKKRIALIALGLLIILELVLLNYSAIWLALVLVTLLLVTYKFMTTFKLNPILTVIVSIFLFFVFIGQSLPPLVSLPTEPRPNLSTTLTVAKESLSMSRLLVGSGPATFGYNYALHRPNELNQTNLWSIRFNQGFSFLTTLLVTGGILGVLAILFLILCLIKQVKALLEKEPLADQVSLIGPITLGTIFLSIAWFFAPIFFTQSIFIFLGLGLITALSGSTKEVCFADFSKRRIFIFLIILIILISGSFASIFSVGKKYLGSIYYAQGIQAGQVGDIDRALRKLEKAIKMDAQQDLYLRDFSQLLLFKIDTLSRQRTGGLLEEGLLLEIQNTAATAISMALQATKINPIDSLNWSNLGNVYERLIFIAEGADSFAEENYQKAMKLDPKNPQEPVNLARNFLTAADLVGERDINLRQEKLNKAKSYLEKSIFLKTDYAPANFLLAIVAIKEGKIQEAIQKLELAKEAAPFDAGLAFQLGVIYYQNDELRKAQAEFERAVGINPDYSNARYFLGLIYDRLGNSTAALEQFKKIAVLNPDNEEVKKIIDNLQNGRPALEKIVPPAQPPTKRLEVPVSETKE